MEERISLSKWSVYNSSLKEGVLMFMALICADPKISILLKKEQLIEITVNVLRKSVNCDFPSLAMEVEQEISNLLPDYDFTDFRETIVECLMLSQYSSDLKLDVRELATISNEKVLKYFDEQLFVNILNCIYDLMIRAREALSMRGFSKRLKIGMKTCNAIYPELENDKAIKQLAKDLNIWIIFNLLTKFCSLEVKDDSIYINVHI